MIFQTTWTRLLPRPLETFTKNLDKIADRISSKYGDGSHICLAGHESKEDTGPGGVESRSAKREEYIKAFSLVSPLITSMSVRPDLWMKSNLGSDIDVPVLLIEIVSGSENDRSVLNFKGVMQYRRFDEAVHEYI